MQKYLGEGRYFYCFTEINEKRRIRIKEKG